MVEENTSRQALVELLAWYEEMGVDEVLSETPVDWLARGTTAPGDGFFSSLAETQPSKPAGQDQAPGDTPTNFSTENPRASSPHPYDTAPRTLAPTPISVPEDVLAEARQLAQQAQTLEDLGNALKEFNGCNLKATAKNMCFFRGTADSEIMVIGEAPGREEDQAGKPFVGRAGQLLDKMLSAIGLDETNTHITNTVYWRPPGNRTPTPQELQICRPFLDRQIEIVNPSILLLLGGSAAKSMLLTKDGIMRLRGKWKELTIADVELRVMSTLHPAYLLRTPAAKRLAWRDLIETSRALTKLR